jgi:hypothetical protein
LLAVIIPTGIGAAAQLRGMPVSLIGDSTSPRYRPVSCQWPISKNAVA